MQSAALAILLACVAGRCFLAEWSFRISAIPPAAVQHVSTEEAPGDASPDRSELSRVSFAIVLLIAWALWLLGAGIRGELRIRHGTLAALIL
ncbi:MAG: hypothetical protein ACYSTL_05230, partial [Planctomycetota bacterium]